MDLDQSKYHKQCNHAMSNIPDWIMMEKSGRCSFVMFEQLILDQQEF